MVQVVENGVAEERQAAVVLGVDQDLLQLAVVAGEEVDAVERGRAEPLDAADVVVEHDRHFLAALSNRVLELTPEGIHQYGGGYTEYVARTGHEAPGLRI